MIPCSGFIEEVLSVDADAGRSARISHPPPFRRVTKNDTNCLPAWHAMR